MRKNFGKKPWFYPLPVLIIGTYDENGVPDAMNAAYGGLYTSDMVEFSIGHNRKTFKNIQKTKAFTVSFADVENMAASDYVGLVSGNDTPDKMQKTGWTITRSENVNAPIFEELPVTWECELVRITEEGNVLGRLKNISVSEKVLDENRQISMEKWTPLVFDHVTYDYLKVEGVAGKSFEVGNQLK
ncbi:MAG TPA: flavin oxidoreductase [Ruminococcaceae bacterium]|nr:flavin oxidoreductase [Oscillospiraceae bacterium]